MNESTIFAVATIVSSILVGLIPLALWLLEQRAKKWRELTVSIHQRWHLESYLDKRVLDDIKEVTQLRPGTASLLDTSLARFTVGNTGRAAIQVGDFDRALRFSFGQNARIQKARVTRTTPPTLEQTVSLQQELSYLEVSPLLINPNESLDIEVFGTNFDTFQPLVRIVGLSEIRTDETERIRASTIYTQYRFPDRVGGCALGVFMLTLLFIVSIVCITTLLLALDSSSGQATSVYLSSSTTSPVATPGSIIDTILNAIADKATNFL